MYMHHVHICTLMYMYMYKYVLPYHIIIDFGRSKLVHVIQAECTAGIDETTHKGKIIFALCTTNMHTPCVYIVHVHCA